MMKKGEDLCELAKQEAESLQLESIGKYVLRT
jgi:hypothetical protein